MKYTTQQFKHCDLVKVSGRIDSLTVQELEAVFNGLLEAGHFNLVCDLSEVEFVSSAGLRLLINVQKSCRKLDRGELVLAQVGERVFGALDLAGFVPLFRMEDDVLQAVGSF